MTGTPVAHDPLPRDAKALRDPCSLPCASRAPRRPNHPVQILSSEYYPCWHPKLNRYLRREKRTTRKWSGCCSNHRAPETDETLEQSERAACEVFRSGKTAAAGRFHPNLGSTDNQREAHHHPDFSPGGARKTCEILD